MIADEAYKSLYIIKGIVFAIISLIMPPPTPVITPVKILKKAFSPKPFAIAVFVPTTVNTPSPTASKNVIKI